MSRIVGYADINLAANSAHLKRAALVTDEIRLTIWKRNAKIRPRNVAELMWLQDKGAVSVHEVVPASGERHLRTTPIQNWSEPEAVERDQFSKLGPDWSERILSVFARGAAAVADQCESDISATAITSSGAEELFRLLTRSGYQNDLAFSGIYTLHAPTAIEVVVNHMPVPDDSTAWEDILTWRSDTAAGEKYRRLKHWVHNVVGGTERPKHLEDQLLTLLDDYRAHMRLHGMRVHSAQTKAIVVPILETVRSVFTGRWGEWAKAAFTVKEQQHALLEAELKAPGREVAYVVDAHVRFGRNGS